MDPAPASRHAVFGTPPRELVTLPQGAVQVSPLHPGASPLAAFAEGSLHGFTMLAPPGTLERRRALALALRALAPGCELIALGPRDKGGSRLAKELQSFGCDVKETVKHHHRICSCVRPASLTGTEAAMNDGALRLVPDTGFYSQPGVFSWDRIDRGSVVLAGVLPELAGRGADLGCGYGVLAVEILTSPAVESLALVDIDGRAVEAARHNVDDRRAEFIWADVRTPHQALASLDFVVMNPPFHDGGAEDRSLGKQFVVRAAGALRKGGVCWLVANRHLPYEAVLKEQFKVARLATDAEGFKVYEAVK